MRKSITYHHHHHHYSNFLSTVNTRFLLMFFTKANAIPVFPSRTQMTCSSLCRSFRAMTSTLLTLRRLRSCCAQTCLTALQRTVFSLCFSSNSWIEFHNVFLVQPEKFLPGFLLRIFLTCRTLMCQTESTCYFLSTKNSPEAMISSEASSKEKPDCQGAMLNITNGLLQ